MRLLKSIFFLLSCLGFSLPQLGWAIRYCDTDSNQRLYVSYIKHNGSPVCAALVACEPLEPGQAFAETENAAPFYVLTLSNGTRELSQNIVVRPHEDIYVTPCAHREKGYIVHRVRGVVTRKPGADACHYDTPGSSCLSLCDAEKNDCESACFKGAHACGTDDPFWCALYTTEGKDYSIENNCMAIPGSPLKGGLRK